MTTVGRCASSLPLPFKPHALLRAEAARADCLGETDEERKRRSRAEEEQWRANVIDLHRVHALAQSLSVLFEQNNEAIVRVALEIVMCPEAWKVLRWREGWYDDDGQREYFRKIVKDKLALCMTGRFDVKPEEAAADDDRVAKAEYDALVARLSEVAAQYESSERAKRLAESRCGELENSLDHAHEKMKKLEKVADELRKSIREKDESLRTAMEAHMEAQQKDQSAGKIAGLEQQIKILEEGNKALAERGKTVGDLEKRLADMDKQLKEQKALTESTTKELQSAKQKVEDAEAARSNQILPVQTKHSANMEQAEAERRAAKQAKEALVAKEAELAEALKKLQLMESRCKQAEGRASAAEQEISKVRVDAKEKSEAQGKKDEDERRKATARRDQGVPQEEHERILGELTKAKEKNAEIRKELFDLKGNNADLQDKNDRMLKMLHEIKEQLARVTAIAEKKGLGKAMNEIMKESKVQETLESDEYTCFNRLYDDAKRRQERQRKLQEDKLGIADRFATHPSVQPRHSNGTDSPRRLSSPALDPTEHDSSQPQYYQDGHYHHRPSVHGTGNSFGGISSAPATPAAGFAYFGTLAAKGGFPSTQSVATAAQSSFKKLAAQSWPSGLSFNASFGTPSLTSEGNEFDGISKANRKTSGNSRPGSSQRDFQSPMGWNGEGFAVKGFNPRGSGKQKDLREMSEAVARAGAVAKSFRASGNRNDLREMSEAVARKNFDPRGSGNQKDLREMSEAVSTKSFEARGSGNQNDLREMSEAVTTKSNETVNRAEAAGRTARTFGLAASFTAGMSQGLGSVPSSSASSATASAMAMDTRTVDRPATANTLPQDFLGSVVNRAPAEPPVRRHLIGAQSAPRLGHHTDELPPLPFERHIANGRSINDAREGLATSPFLSSIGTNSRLRNGKLGSSTSEPRLNSANLIRGLSSSGGMRRTPSPRDTHFDFPSPGRRPNRSPLDNLFSANAKKPRAQGGGLDDWMISGIGM